MLRVMVNLGETLRYDCNFEVGEGADVATIPDPV